MQTEYMTWKEVIRRNIKREDLISAVIDALNETPAYEDVLIEQEIDGTYRVSYRMVEKPITADCPWK